MGSKHTSIVQEMEFITFVSLGMPEDMAARIAKVSALTAAQWMKSPRNQELAKKHPLSLDILHFAAYFAGLRAGNANTIKYAKEYLIERGLISIGDKVDLDKKLPSDYLAILKEANKKKTEKK